MDFAAQMSLLNNGPGGGSSPGDEGRGRGRSFSRCQVTPNADFVPFVSWSVINAAVSRAPV